MIYEGNLAPTGSNQRVREKEREGEEREIKRERERERAHKRGAGSTQVHGAVITVVSGSPE